VICWCPTCVLAAFDHVHKVLLLIRPQRLKLLNCVNVNLHTSNTHTWI
jgi:hypothetical protein